MEHMDKNALVMYVNKYHDVIQLISGLEETHLEIDALGEWKRGEVMSQLCETCMKDCPDIHIDTVDACYEWLILLLRSLSIIFPSRWNVPELMANEFCNKTRSILTTLLKRNKDGVSIPTLISSLEKTVKFETYLTNRFELEDMPTENKGKFKKSISIAFEPYIDLCLSEEDANLHTLFVKIVGEETWMIEDDFRYAVLDSGTDLMYSLNTCLLRCAKLGSIKILWNLHKVFCKYINNYSDALMTHTSSGFQNQNVKLLCLIANTSEFLRQRCEQFENSFKKMIAMETHVIDETITFENEILKLSTVRSRCVELLATLTCAELAKPFQVMTHIQWFDVKDVNDESTYVTSIISIIKEKCVPLMQRYLDACPDTQTSLYNAFCIAFVKKFNHALVENIFACKRIGEHGAVQLLLDVSCLNTMIQQLICCSDLKPDDEIHSEMKYIGQILKVVASPNDIIINVFHSVFPTGTARDFARILDLRGVTRVERNVLLETFTGTSAKKQNITTQIVGMFDAISAVRPKRNSIDEKK